MCGYNSPHLHKMTPKAIVLSGVVFCLIENLGDFLSENKHFVQAMRTCTRKNSNCGLPCVFHKIDTFIGYTQNKKKDTLLKKESVDVNLIW